jgi:myo-inositol-1(or 4)-monophosphatase
MNTMPPRLKQALDLVEIASQMGLAASKARSDVGARAKGPQDFVSEIDEKIERQLRDGLRQAFPEDTVSGEEFGVDMSARHWVIDPIDGTANFLRGIPLWSVSLGWIHNGEPVVGVVAMPALGLVVAAERHQGLYLNGKRVTRESTFNDVRVVSVGDSRTDLAYAQGVTKVLREAGWVVESWRSTAAAMAHVALGRMDGHIQGQVKLWDMAGGLALCAEAGLTIHHQGLDRIDNQVVVGTQSVLDVLAGAAPLPDCA